MRTVLDIEQQRQRQQDALDSAKDPGERNRCGQFATPMELARDIAEYAWSHWKTKHCPVDFLDPAFGTGAFYSALRQVCPAESVRRAAGIEIDPVVVAAAESLWEAPRL